MTIFPTRRFVSTTTSHMTRALALTLPMANDTDWDYSLVKGAAMTLIAFKTSTTCRRFIEKLYEAIKDMRSFKITYIEFGPEHPPTAIVQVQNHTKIGLVCSRNPEFSHHFLSIHWICTGANME